ncbi:MAG: GTP-binding protein [Candidatus Lokiarchaeota archaeon]|nr:GTP-binding protein [Candidatus Lokiarchaeota archaeon]
MENYLFKILLGGCVGRQRTEIMKQFTTGRFHPDTSFIIGVDFAVHFLDLPEKEGAVTLQIWDFGEEKRFRTLVSCFCQGAAGAMLFFDLHDQDTLYDLEEWIHLIRKYTHNIPIILCGVNCKETTKSEQQSNLDELDRINEEDIHDFLNKHHFRGYYDIHMESGRNITESFEYLSALMVQQWPSSVLNQSTRIETLLPNQIR